MKKLLIAIIFVLIAPFNVMAGYPGECVVYVKTNLSTGSGSEYRYTGVNSENGQLVEIGRHHSYAAFSYIKFEMKYYENGSWYLHSSKNSSRIDGGDYSFDSNIDWVSSLPAECPTDCSDQETEAINECGESNWQWTNEENCEYECKCDNSEIQKTVTQCGGAAYSTIDYDTCTVTCLPIAGDCSDEHAALQEGCKPFGIKTFNTETCEGTCNNTCDEQWVELEEYCGIYGVQSRRESDCWGECLPEPKDCEEFRSNCETTCEPHGGIAEDGYFCDPSMESSVCQCKEPTRVGDPEAGIAPDEKEPDPDEKPPQGDPDGDPDDGANGWLKGIKKNTDSIVDQNNDRAKQLSELIHKTRTIGENTKTIADNQAITQKQIQSSGDKIEEKVKDLKSSNIEESGKTQDEIKDLKASNLEGLKDIQGMRSGTTTPGTLAGVIDAVNGIGDVDMNYDLDFSQLATNSPAPTLSGDEYDSSLPTDNDYTEHDDNQTLATDQAGSYIAEMELVEEQELFLASITAIGQPCITGNVTFHGNNVPVSICFNKSWMLTGYAIMKVIFIGLAYIQSAMMLTRSII